MEQSLGMLVIEFLGMVITFERELHDITAETGNPLLTSNVSRYILTSLAYVTVSLRLESLEMMKERDCVLMKTVFLMIEDLAIFDLWRSLNES